MQVNTVFEGGENWKDDIQLISYVSVTEHETLITRCLNTYYV